MKITAQQTDQLAAGIFKLAGWLSVIILLGIFAMLLFNGVKAFFDITPGSFFFGLHWNPAAYRQPQFGILSRFSARCSSRSVPC